ncbi:MAG: DUF4214 domain-containing protein [Clostridiales bacterium]|nr:DUF4214 domain-containing protein [Clostridiales bacterium]
MKKKRMKRIVTFILSALLLVSGVDVSVFAADTSMSVQEGELIEESVEVGSEIVASADPGTRVVATFDDFKKALADPSVSTISLWDDIMDERTDGDGDSAFFITRPVKIVGNGYKITHNAAGIVLGANVTYENIRIEFINAVRNAIIANGYELTLNRVAAPEGAKFSVHVFAGGVTDYNGRNKAELPASGSHGKVTITNTGNNLGNIYAGSLSDIPNAASVNESNYNRFEGESTIVVTGADNGLIGTIFASGAREYRGEGDGNGLDPDHTKYRSSKVNISLDGPFVKTVNGNMGDGAYASVTYTDTRTNKYEAGPSLYDISNLTMVQGNLKPAAGSRMSSNANVTLQGGYLDVSQVANIAADSPGELQVNEFHGGGGILILGQRQTLSIQGAVSGTTTVAVGGYNKATQQSFSPALRGRTYIKVSESIPATGTEFAFCQYASSMDGVPQYRQATKEWTTDVPQIGSSDVISSISLPQTHKESAGIFWMSIPVDVTYQGNLIGLETIPVKVMLNGTSASMTQDELGYTYEANGMTIRFGLYDDGEKLDVEAVQDLIPEGVYNIRIEIPGEYMADKRAKALDISITVGEAKKISVPVAQTGLVFNGNTQVGVPTGEGYHLDGDYQKRNAGNYSAYATPKAGYTWTDGTTEEKTIQWSIEKAAGSGSVNLPDWTQGENAAVPVPYSSTNGNTNVTYLYKVATADDSTYKSFQTPPAAAGDYRLKAVFAETTNYKEVVAYTDFTIRAVGTGTNTKIAVPVAQQNLVYSGLEQQGVSSGVGYRLSGVYKATNAGSYTAIVTPQSGYEWTDGTQTARNISWSIGKANGSGSVRLSGWTEGQKAGTPVPTSSTNGTSRVTYQYKQKNASDNTYKSFQTPPSAAGAYTLKAVFAETTNYKEAVAYTDFTIQTALPTNKKISVPTARVGLTYNGVIQEGVFAGEGYTLSGTYRKREPGSYVAIVTPKAGYEWTDGTKNAKSISWNIKKAFGYGTVSILGWTEGEQAQTPQAYSATNGNQNVTYLYKVATADDSTYRSFQTPPTAAGTYRLKAVFAETTYYAEAVSHTSFTISAAPASDIQQEETGVTGYVSRLYKQVLERNPDDTGLADWEERLHSGEYTGTDVAVGFIMSQEYLGKATTHEEYVDMLYSTVMGREADEAGRAYWVNRLENGMSRGGILAGFVGSPEFDGICKDYGILTGSYVSGEVVDQQPEITAFVARMYTIVLERGYDTDGLTDWTAQLLRREKGGGTLSKGFFFSQEFLDRQTSDEEFVTICYRTYLNREPDDMGLGDWVRQLENGKSREAVLDGFIMSAEFGRLCAQYGMDQN